MKCSIFSKKEYSQLWNNGNSFDKELLYFNSIPILLFFLEEQRKNSSISSQGFKGLMSNMKKLVNFADTNIDLTRSMILSSLNNSDFCSQNFSLKKNPFYLSSIIGNAFYDYPWWDTKEVLDSIEDSFR